MKCNRKQLMAALRVVKHGVVQRDSYPHHANVCLTGEDDCVELKTSDGRILVSAMVAAEGDEFDGTSVSWQAIYDLVRTIKGDEVEIVGNGHRLRVAIDGHEAELEQPGSLPRAGSMRLPDVGDFKTQVFDAAQLSKALKFVLSAACKDDSRPHLNGVCFMVDGRLVATDGHRLHVASDLPAFDRETITAAGPVIRTAIRATGAKYVAGLASTQAPVLEWSINGEIDVWVREKRNECQFPPIDGVIPNHENSFCVDRSKLRAEVMAAVDAIKADNRTKEKGDRDHNLRVAFHVDGNLRELDLGYVNDGEAETIKIEGRPMGDSTVAINGHYMKQALSDGDDVIRFFYGDRLKPIYLGLSDRFAAVVMPQK